MNKKSKIYIAGHSGLVGTALRTHLKLRGYNNLIYRSHSVLDLTDKCAVEEFFSRNLPEYVFLAASKVGGIWANSTYPAEFIHENLQIYSNVIHAAYVSGVRKLLFLGSSCIYPKEVKQPILEECLLSGKLEKTNDAYSIAKIAGIIMCKSYNKQYGTNFAAVMPTNLYGPGDNFHPTRSHVLPALIVKMHAAKVQGDTHVTLWGSGDPRREFLYVDDLVEALVIAMQSFNPTEDNMFINIGYGADLSIRELALAVKNVVGFEGSIVWDASMPDGVQSKLLNIDRIKRLGWKPRTALLDGIGKTYSWFLKNECDKT